MKKEKVISAYVGAICIGPLFVYLFGSFIVLSWDIYQWDSAGRVVAGLAATGLSAIAVSLVEENT